MIILQSFIVIPMISLYPLITYPAVEFSLIENVILSKESDPAVIDSFP
jgi:hypothetical protein